MRDVVRALAGDRSWLVKIEILAILLLNLALVFLGLLAWIGFAVLAVESGLYTVEAGSPYSEDHVPSYRDHYIDRAYTPMGVALWALSVGLPAAFLCALAMLVHRLVVKPLAEGDRCE